MSSRGIYRRRGKRLFGLALAVPAALLLLPVAVGIAVVVRASLGRPILFRQRRPGRGGRGFTLRKFRTMRDAFDDDGRPLPDEQRLTRLGQFLRRTSLDELPELWNVIRGDMSLVGPRPLLMEYLDRYTPEQARRHDVKPGITGWAQVNGRNALDWETKFELDVWYVDHESLWLDFRILAITLWKVLKGEGISAGEHPTMPDFVGSPHD